jgi:hypothetical protein
MLCKKKVAKQKILAGCFVVKKKGMHKMKSSSIKLS